VYITSDDIEESLAKTPAEVMQDEVVYSLQGKSWRSFVPKSPRRPLLMSSAGVMNIIISTPYALPDRPPPLHPCMRRHRPEIHTTTLHPHHRRWRMITSASSAP
jgi:hypothetical protein